ncbi:hypothetical protein [Legionella gresilensis]|uniref:hypothetical protein n=1 Tax=Legionella gresilensis TaxID=91823 RepID=UPI0010418078|nr:hypothetical protein [Legionella gresilensis]
MFKSQVNTLFKTEDEYFQDFLKKVEKKAYSRFDLTSFFLTKEKEIYVRGHNKWGELGLSDNKSRRYVDGYKMPTKIPGLPPIKDFAIGHGISFLIDDHNQIYAFGHNDYGQLGLGHCQDVSSPTVIKSLKYKRITKIACWTNTYFLSEQGDVYFSGKYDFQKTCTSSPQKMHSLPPICKIVTGHNYDLFLSTAGEVYRRGNNLTTGTIYPTTDLTKLPYTGVKDIHRTWNKGPAILTEYGEIYLGESTKPLDMPPVERVIYGYGHGDYDIFELKNGDIIVEKSRLGSSIGVQNERYGIDASNLYFENRPYEAQTETAKQCKQILDLYVQEEGPIYIEEKVDFFPKYIGIM